jgi:hypothetical protein
MDTPPMHPAWMQIPAAMIAYVVNTPENQRILRRGHSSSYGLEACRGLAARRA